MIAAGFYMKGSVIFRLVSLVGGPMVYQLLLLCVNPHQQKLISQWPSTKFIRLEDV